MVTSKFVAKSFTSKLFIGENGSIVKDPEKASYFCNACEAMKACIEANDNLGKAAFKICEVTVSETETENEK